MTLNDRIAFVSGGSGLRRAIALSFAAAAAHVIVNKLRRAAAEQAVSEMIVGAVHLDGTFF